MHPRSRAVLRLTLAFDHHAGRSPCSIAADADRCSARTPDNRTAMALGKRITALGRPSYLRVGLPPAREALHEGPLYNPERHQHHRFCSMAATRVFARAYVGAQVNWLLGYPERATRLQ